MTDVNPTEKENQGIDVDRQNTNPAWALGLVAFSIVSFVIGLFILPQKVEIVRFVEISAERETVWKHIDQIEDWDAWDTFGHKHEKKNGTSTRLFAKDEYEGNLSFIEVDTEEFRIFYELDQKNGAGDLFVERTPDGVRVFWHHSYMCGFGPFSRMIHWLSRGKLALELDKSLEKLQELSTSQSK